LCVTERAMFQLVHNVLQFKDSLKDYLCAVVITDDAEAWKDVVPKMFIYHSSSYQNIRDRLMERKRSSRFKEWHPQQKTILIFDLHCLGDRFISRILEDSERDELLKDAAESVLFACASEFRGMKLGSSELIKYARWIQSDQKGE
jgi:hypothetical protein